MIPNPRLVRVLERAYPCPGFDGPCGDLSFEPKEGLVPRGFCGATGNADEVELVIVLSQPPLPTPEHAFDRDDTAFEIITAVCRRTYVALRIGGDLYHRNLKFILDQCLAGFSLEEQLKRAWITHSVLCSPPPDADGIPPDASRYCRANYLERQLELFPEARVLALGIEAQRRLKGLPGLLEAPHPAPPACNRPGVREGWVRIGEHFRAA